MHDWFLSVKQIAQNAIQDTNQGNAYSSLCRMFSSIKTSPDSSDSESEYKYSSVSSDSDVECDFNFKEPPIKKKKMKYLEKCVNDFRITGLALKNTNDYRNKLANKNTIYGGKTNNKEYRLIICPPRPCINQMAFDNFNAIKYDNKNDENDVLCASLPIPRFTNPHLRGKMIARIAPVLQNKSVYENVIDDTSKLEEKIIVQPSEIENISNISTEFKVPYSIEKPRMMESADILKFNNLPNPMMLKKSPTKMVPQNDLCNLSEDKKLDDNKNYLQIMANPALLKKNSPKSKGNKSKTKKMIKEKLDSKSSEPQVMSVKDHYVKDGEVYYIIHYSTNRKSSIPLLLVVKDKTLVDLVFEYNNSNKL